MKQELPMSIICIYNDQEQIDNIFMRGYNEQNNTCELVLINNINHDYKSAVDGILEGLKQATNDVILIMHQDILLLGKNELKRFYDRLKDSKDEIIGVAGTIKDPVPYFYSSIFDGPKKELVSEFRVDKEKEVLTVDECLFGFNRQILDKISFDPVVCNNWHFYAVDLCYQAKLKGMKVVVINSNVWHSPNRVSGKRNHAFYENVKLLQEKYKDSFDEIHTCCIGIGINEDPFVYERKEKIKEKIPKGLKRKYQAYKWSINKRLKKLRK